MALGNHMDLVMKRREKKWKVVNYLIWIHGIQFTIHRNMKALGCGGVLLGFLLVFPVDSYYELIAWFMIPYVCLEKNHTN